MNEIKKPTTSVSMANSGKVRYLSINNNTYMDNVCAYMDPSDTAYSTLAVYNDNVVGCSNISADDSMDHVHNNRQETGEQAHIDVSF